MGYWAVFCFENCGINLLVLRKNYIVLEKEFKKREIRKVNSYTCFSAALLLRLMAKNRIPSAMSPTPTPIDRNGSVL